MNFSEALQECKKGARISRSGWNGKSQYVELATRISYVNAKGETVNADHAAIGNSALAFVGTSGTQIGWLASQADMLADDWQLLTDVDASMEESYSYERAVADIKEDVKTYLAIMRMLYEGTKDV